MPESENPDAKLQRREQERERQRANIFLLLAAIAVIGAGIWLVDAMVAAKRADDCISAGRRNCTSLDVPTR